GGIRDLALTEAVTALNAETAATGIAAVSGPGLRLFALALRARGPVDHPEDDPDGERGDAPKVGLIAGHHVDGWTAGHKQERAENYEHEANDRKRFLHLLCLQYRVRPHPLQRHARRAGRLQHDDTP